MNINYFWAKTLGMDHFIPIQQIVKEIQRCCINATLDLEGYDNILYPLLSRVSNMQQCCIYATLDHKLFYILYCPVYQICNNVAYMIHWTIKYRILPKQEKSKFLCKMLQNTSILSFYRIKCLFYRCLRSFYPHPIDS